jgi:hypothetical protein
MAEAQADYVVKALEELDAQGAHALEPRRDHQDAWTEDVQARSQGTVWLAGGCASWYLDHNGHNTTLWPDYAHRFTGALRDFRAEEFVLHAEHGVEEPGEAGLEVVTP